MEQKKLTAAQVKKLPVGTWVTYHIDGNKVTSSGMLVQSGRKKYLKMAITGILRPIVECSEGKYYTEVD